LTTVTSRVLADNGDSPMAAADLVRGPIDGQTFAAYGHLMAAAAGMFEPAELDRLAPRLHSNPMLAVEHNGHARSGRQLSALEPLAATEAIAYDFLAKGGKYSRPFITLAVYDALTGGPETEDGASGYLAQLPTAVKRCALSIEAFHKASLVHDDIQDDDEFRYGCSTLHRRYGTPTAINVGDYLIGLGYRLVTREREVLGAEVVGDILYHIADAHMKLSEGQGAELIWRDSQNKRLTPADTLKIYALKTAPAFQAALHTGLRLAGPTAHFLEPIRQFARNLGIAFQIVNDLNDWQGDDHNKLVAAGDVIRGRPTVLWALALAGLRGEKRSRLEQLVSDGPLPDAALADVRGLFDEAGAFERAGQLVTEHQERAEITAGQIQPDRLRQLLLYLIDVVLKHRRGMS
jgi:geranylgeranyl pyrophosphate synthase